MKFFRDLVSRNFMRNNFLKKKTSQIRDIWGKIEELDPRSWFQLLGSNGHPNKILDQRLLLREPVNVVKRTGVDIGSSLSTIMRNRQLTHSNSNTDHW